jgi:uncharacterized protein
VDLVFLDANVLFSAAYRVDAGLRRLWRLPAVELVTSAFAAEEARRNLATTEQRVDMDRLMEAIRLVPFVLPREHALFGTIALPEKDWPILLAAVSAQATHLLTGDARHFGPLYGQRIEGVLILPPADYLRGLRAQDPQ